MPFETLSPPSKKPWQHPVKIRISKRGDAPAKATLTLKTDVWSQMGEPDFVNIMLGNGIDTGRMNVLPSQEGHNAFKVIHKKLAHGEFKEINLGTIESWPNKKMETAACQATFEKRILKLVLPKWAQPSNASVHKTAIKKAQAAEPARLLG